MSIKRGLIFAVVVVVLATLAKPAGASLTPEKRVWLTAAFDHLSNTEDVDTGNEALRAFADAEISEDDWQSFFRTFFASRALTPTLARFWGTALGASGFGYPRVASLAAICGGEAASVQLARLVPDSKTPLDAAALAAALGVFAPNLPMLGAEKRAALLEQLLGAFKEKKLDLATALNPKPATEESTPPEPGASVGNTTTPLTPGLAMQICFALGGCAGEDAKTRALVSDRVELPESVRSFWGMYGMFLFDGNALDPAQRNAIGALVRTFPRTLHFICGLVVPEGLGAELLSALPALPGQVVAISTIPMDQPTNPAEFIAEAGQPVAPEFTVSAAQQIFRAVQMAQFMRRPALEGLRDALGVRANGNSDAYLRRMAPISLYAERPDELLSQTAYLWFIDSAAAFRMALVYFVLGQRQPMDAVLLVADVLSGGGNTTRAFGADSSGQLVSAEIPIARTRLTDLATSPTGDVFITGIDCVNGVFVSGRSYTFVLDPTGAAVSILEDLSGLGL